MDDYYSFPPSQIDSKPDPKEIILLSSLTIISLGPTSPTWIQQTEMQPAYIDAVAMMIGDTDIRISILNRHPTADWTTKIDFAGFGEYNCPDIDQKDRCLMSADINTVEVHELYSEDMGATVSIAMGPDSET